MQREQQRDSSGRLAGPSSWATRAHVKEHADGMDHDHAEDGVSIKRLVVVAMLVLVAGGLLAGWLTGHFVG